MLLRHKLIAFCGGNEKFRKHSILFHSNITLNLLYFCVQEIYDLAVVVVIELESVILITKTKHKYLKISLRHFGNFRI